MPRLQNVCCAAPVTVTRGVAGAVISSSPHPPPKYQRTSEMCFDKAAGSLVDTKSVHMLNVEPLLPPGVGWLSVGAQLWRSSAGDRQGPSILEISNVGIDDYKLQCSAVGLFRWIGRSPRLINDIKCLETLS